MSVTASSACGDGSTMEVNDHAFYSPPDSSQLMVPSGGTSLPPATISVGVSHAVAQLQAEIESTRGSAQAAGPESADIQFPKLFFTRTLDEANQVISSYELKTNAKFVVYKESRNFGRNAPLHSMACTKEGDEYRVNHRISWEDRETSLALYNRIPYDGVPFMLLARKIYDCHLGVLRGKHKRDLSKKSRKSQGSRKVGCTAQITLREIHKFPEFRIEKSSHSHHYRALKSIEIRRAILNCEDIGERRIYVSLPSINDHSGHDMTRVDRFSTDPRVKKKMYQLAYQGHLSIKDLRARTKEYVEEELFKGVDLPSLTDTRFHPSDTALKNISYLARMKMKKQGMPLPGHIQQRKSRKAATDTSVPHMGQEVTVGSSPPPLRAAPAPPDPSDDFFTVLGEIQGLAVNVGDNRLLKNLTDNLLIVRDRLKQETISSQQRLEHPQASAEFDFIQNIDENVKNS